MQTPDEYCDGITGIAFDRVTTAKAYADGIAARDAELAKQEPVAVIFRLRSGEWQLRMDQPPDGTLKNPTQLFAHPIPPPDVRELVEIATHILALLDHETRSVTSLDADKLRAALSKHRGQP